MSDADDVDAQTAARRAKTAAAIRRTLSGDKQAFGDVVALHQDGLFSLALGVVGGRDEASEVVQEAFVSAYTALKGYDPARPFFPWLCAICVNVGRKRLNRNKRRLDAPLCDRDEAGPELEAAADEALGPESGALSRERERLLRKALACLPAESREAVSLRYLSGLSLKETALALDLGVDAAKMRIYRALGTLKKLLPDDVL